MILKVCRRRVCIDDRQSRERPDFQPGVEGEKLFRQKVNERLQTIKYQPINQSINQMGGCKKRKYELTDQLKKLKKERDRTRFILIFSRLTCKASSVGSVSGLQARWKTCFRSSTFLLGWQHYYSSIICTLG